MYISDLIQDVVDKKLKEYFIGKTIKFDDVNKGPISILVKDAYFVQDDGHAWAVFKDEKGDYEYTPEGQGLDTWFEVI